MPYKSRHPADPEADRPRRFTAGERDFIDRCLVASA
jgi:hypothetical protein